MLLKNSLLFKYLPVVVIVVVVFRKKKNALKSLIFVQTKDVVS